MTIVRFQQVKLKGVRFWYENGKKRQETKIFFQTINPFNKNRAGLPKDRSEIFRELIIERDQWLRENS
jgi:hypothetical protein